MFNKLVTWLIGKKILTQTGQMDAVSKAKLVAVIGVLLPAIETLSKAWGHPIVIPPQVYAVLAAAGLWTVRDAMPPK